MRTYTIRDKDGIMLMRMVGPIAERIITEGMGEWRNYQERGKPMTKCFQLKEDGVFGLEAQAGAFKVFLWEGTKIIVDV